MHRVIARKDSMSEASRAGCGINSNVRVFPYLVFILVFLFASMFDMPVTDGLRHVGLASVESRSWGEVYPYSRYADASEVNPWYGFDKSLRYLFKIIDASGLPPLVSKILLLKIMMFVIGLGSLLLLVHKSGTADEVRDIPSLVWFVTLTVFFLCQPVYRSMMVRPFIFGTLFLVYSIGQKGFVRGAASSALLTFFYPYLAWFYILPAVFGHTISGSRKFAMGAFCFLLGFLILQPPGYWDLQSALFEAGRVRSQLGASITELGFSFSHFFSVFYFGLFLAAYPFFSKKIQKPSYRGLLVFIYLPPAVLYVRTFLDVFLPLIFVGYGRELYGVLRSWVTIVGLKWRDFLQASLVNRAGSRLDRFFKPSPNGKPSVPLRVAIAFGFLLAFYLAFSLNRGQLAELRAFQACLSKVPAGATVLTSFNQQYRVLFLRPDLKLIPSSEIGFPSSAIEEAYVRFFKHGSFFELSEKTGAYYLVEARDIYLDPGETAFLEPLSAEKDFRVWRISKNWGKLGKKDTKVYDNP